MVSLALENLSKVYPNGVVGVRRVDLDVQAGEFIALVGPSGCGKTTTLRMVAGFEKCSAGRVLIERRDVTRLPPERRPTAMVFQDYALFPHLNVRENIAFGLRFQSRGRPSERIADLARMLRLEDVLNRQIDSLSGGQRQRVALARALSVEPSILLLDEPLGALDASLRKEVQSELKILQRRLGLTFLFVTHSQAEALALSDRIVVMNAGWVEQVSTPEDLCARPTSRFVAKFVGRNLVLDADVIDRRGGEVQVETRLGTFGAKGELRSGNAALSINLDRIDIAGVANRREVEANYNSLEARVVTSCTVAGRISLSLGLADGSEIRVDRRADRFDTGALEAGASVKLTWKIEDATLVTA
ncbi:ABC transporter ATP-binding protein [Bradyrhizobium sp. WSM3983]|uniref:ABC transporter ATP-binding protein n=1 Tax=Bradyrhizobium sp. WSM3983 TaxID=1038867 RepID=UPI0006890BA6|nr:ABC transporter ATP-binding protein [Bradyrhizobium sp. WSM3983]